MVALSISSAVLLYCRFSLFLKDPFFQIIQIKEISKTTRDYNTALTIILISTFSLFMENWQM